MKFKGISSVAILGLLTMVGFVLVSAGAVHHLFQTPLPQAAAAGGGPSGTQKANLEAYATLLHENVVDQKEQVVALVLSLNEADAAKFWPIYSQYEAELDKLNAIAAASIDDYLKNAGHLSEQQADQLVHNQTQVQSLVCDRCASGSVTSQNQNHLQPVGSRTWNDPERWDLLFFSAPSQE